jgi:hypothetical protein
MTDLSSLGGADAAGEALIADSTARALLTGERELLRLATAVEPVSVALDAALGGVTLTITARPKLLIYDTARPLRAAALPHLKLTTRALPEQLITLTDEVITLYTDTAALYRVDGLTAASALAALSERPERSAAVEPIDVTL